MNTTERFIRHFAEAPKDAKVILKNVRGEKPKYNAKRVARLRELARAKKSD